MKRDCVVVAAFAFLALLIASCGRQATSTSGPTSTSTALPANAGSGCGQGHATGLSLESMTAGGLKRTYRLYVPKAYDGAKKTPLVLNFHGFTSTALEQEAYTRMPAEADKAGFITVAADGTGSPQRWFIYGPNEPGFVDDAAFVNALIDHLEAGLCIDPDRIYATGMSNGAGLSSELACELNDRLAAVAPVAGLTYAQAYCQGKAPMPVVAFHGTADALVPFEGGPGGRLNLNLRSVPENLKDWAAHDGCTAGPASERVSSDVVRESYSGCQAGTDVVLYVVEDGGHTWPNGAGERPSGKTTRTIDATSLIWDFFAAHSRQGR